MIAIINVDPNPRATGMHQYEVRINRDLITRFEHAREEGLATCLRKAAAAVEKANDLELYRARSNNYWRDAL